MSGSEVRDGGAPKGVADQPSMESVNESRRRWVLGALAGPAVVSLPATASAAAMGSMSTCVENLYAPTQLPLHVAPENMDKYARKEMQGILAEKGSPNGKGYKTEALVDYNGQVYDEFWNKWPASGKGYTCPTTGETYKDNGLRVQRWTLLFASVDNFGSFVETNPDATQWNMLPLTGTCMASISPLKV
jgi:hypothetical protein